MSKCKDVPVTWTQVNNILDYCELVPFIKEHLRKRYNLPVKVKVSRSGAKYIINIYTRSVSSDRIDQATAFIQGLFIGRLYSWRWS